MSALANPKSRLNDTLAYFLDHLDWDKPLSFDEWNSLPNKDQKIAALYIQFFDQICYAWAKARADYIDDDDLVSCVLQYLDKNVTKIENDPKRFTTSYIQTVAYNCMDCLRCLKNKIDKANYEVSTIVYHNEEDELNLLDLHGTRDEPELHQDANNFWSIIENMGEKTEKVVQYLISDRSLRRTPKHSAAYAVDPLKDVSVSLSERDEIIENLRVKLEPFRDVDFDKLVRV